MGWLHQEHEKKWDDAQKGQKSRCGQGHNHESFWERQISEILVHFSFPFLLVFLQKYRIFKIRNIYSKPEKRRYGHFPSHFGSFLSHFIHPEFLDILCKKCALAGLNATYCNYVANLGTKTWISLIFIGKDIFLTDSGKAFPGCQKGFFERFFRHELMRNPVLNGLITDPLLKWPDFGCPWHTLFDTRK